jgi:hypothetical protein
MLIRFIQLRNAITAYHSEGNVSEQLGSLELRNDEWELAEYLLVLTNPFAINGYTMCAETHPTISLVRNTYNSLFQHLEDEKMFIEDHFSFQHSMLIRAIDAAYKKLSKYCQQMANDLGDYYNLGNILNTSCKATIYDSSTWSPNFPAKYKQNFFDAFNKDYAMLAMSSFIQTRGSEAPQSLALFSQTSTRKRIMHSTSTYEAEQYLSGGKTSLR